MCRNTDLVEVAEEVWHGGELPEAAAGEAEVLPLRVPVAQDVQQRVTLPHQRRPRGT